MRQALRAAGYAAACGEVPVGAAVVDSRNQLVALASNRKNQDRQPSAHAEMLALFRAARVLGDWRLQGMTLYSTLEPCAMCFGAAVQSRITRIVYGAPEPKFGVIESHARLHEVPFNHPIEVRAGVLSEDCAAIMRVFFAERRTGQSANL